MNIYAIGSSHCRNIFSDENFGCSNGADNKLKVIRKWSSKGLHLKDVDINGRNEYSMNEFISGKPPTAAPAVNEIRCYVFGEIDIRVHAGHGLRDGDYTKNIENMVTDYINKLPNNEKTFVIGVQPPMYADQYQLLEKHMYRWDSISDIVDYRPAMTNLMNKMLEEKCKNNDMNFINPWTSYELDENGFLPLEQTDKVCHVLDASKALDEIFEVIYKKFVIDKV